MNNNISNCCITNIDFIYLHSAALFFTFYQTVLPQPLSGSNVGGQQFGHQLSSQIPRSKYRPINLRDLFVAPPFDELDAVAMDGTGEPRRLTNTQLKTLRERGLVFIYLGMLLSLLSRNQSSYCIPYHDTLIYYVFSSTSQNF